MKNLLKPKLDKLRLENWLNTSNLEDVLVNTFGWVIPKCWYCGRKMELLEISVKDNVLWQNDGTTYFECSNHPYILYIRFTRDCGVDKITEIGSYV